MATIVRPLVKELTRRLSERKSPLQIVVGPRQVGKTTAVQQVMDSWQGVSHYASADLNSIFVPIGPGPSAEKHLDGAWIIGSTSADTPERPPL